MKPCIYILFIFILINTAFSSSLSIFSLDDSNFPIMKAKIFALDEKGNIINNLNNSNLLLKEDDIDRQIDFVNCPEVKPPDAISSVLTIDISGSMYGEGLKKAKAAATAWINALPLGKSECAITSFDSENYLNSDFSTDRNKLQKAIDSLQAQGGTDFNAALINQFSGSLLIAESAKHQKIIVILTDGYSSGNEQEIIQKAKSMNVVIYCVVLANPAPDILKNISSETGGTYFENINTVDEATNAYNNILQMAQGGTPCDIQWLSSGCPNNRLLQLSIPNYSISANIRYSISYDRLPNLSLLPGVTLKYGEVLPGYFKKNTIKIVCGSTEVFISDVKTDNNLFKIKNFPAGGLNLKSGEQFDLNIEFNPIDSSYQFARFELITNACRGAFFYASGGFTGSSSTPNTLQILEPNGGEIYSSLADTIVTWSGVSPEDTMKIELSTDAGINWEVLTNLANNLYYKIKMPDINSSNCLIRIKQLVGNGTKLKSFAGHTFFVENISLSPNGQFLSSTGSDRVFKVIDLKTGQQVFKTTGVYIYQCSAFSPDGKMLAVGLSDYSVIIYSTADWSILKTIEGNDGWVNQLSFDPTSKILAIADNSNKIRLIKIEDNSTIASLNSHTNTITKIEWIKSDNTLLSASKDGTIKQWSNSGEALKTINTNQSIESMTISPDNYKIATIINFGRLIKIYDLQSSAELSSFIPLNTATSIDWSPDGTLITVADNLGNVNFYETESNQLVKSIQLHATSVNEIIWSSNGKFIASCGNDNYIKTLDFELIIQEAVSKYFWEITKPNIIANDVNFGSVDLGSAKDSVLTSYITNNSKIPILINKIEFTGTASNDFFLVSGIPPFEIPANSSKTIEIQFSPNEEGFRSTYINISSPTMTINKILTGIGNQSKIEYISKYINFGKKIIDSETDTTFKILQNKSNQDITFSNFTIIGPDKNQFSIIDNDSKTIKPGDYLILSFRYLPNEIGKSNTAIRIDMTNFDSHAQIQLFGEAFSECGSNSFNYKSFSDVSDLSFVAQSIKTTENSILLTEASEHTLGAFWTNSQIPLDSGFSTEFSFKITEPNQNGNIENSEPGADGIVFVIQNYSNKAVGISGGGIGYEGIPNAIALEIDLFNNNKNQFINKLDSNGNHLALMIIENKDSLLRATHTKENTLAINYDILTIKSDGTTYYCKAVYNILNSTFEFYIDTTKNYIKPALNIPNFNIHNYMKLEYNSGAYFGFTGACGSSFQKQEILNWNLCTALNTKPIISVVNEPDNKSIHNLNVYPNPATEETIINIPSKIGDKIYIQGYDLLGRKTETNLNFISEKENNQIKIQNKCQCQVEFLNISINNQKFSLLPVYWRK